MAAGDPDQRALLATARRSPRDFLTPTMGQDLIGWLLRVLQQPSNSVLITGGGAGLDGPRRLIEARAQSVGKETPRNDTVIDPASVGA